jgi:hypothetical protein
MEGVYFGWIAEALAGTAFCEEEHQGACPVAACPDDLEEEDGKKRGGGGKEGGGGRCCQRQVLGSMILASATGTLLCTEFKGCLQMLIAFDDHDHGCVSGAVWCVGLGWRGNFSSTLSLPRGVSLVWGGVGTGRLLCPPRTP